MKQISLLSLLLVLCLYQPTPALESTLGTPTWTTDYSSPRDTWSGLRVATFFNSSMVSDDALTELKTDIVPIVTRWLGKVLKVPKLNIPLKVTQQYCGQAVIPKEHKSDGIEADVVIYLVAVPYKYHNVGDKTSYGTACLLNEEAPYRVLAGTVWVQMDWFNGLTHNQKVDLVAKCFAQVLGFDSLLFQHFTKRNGVRYEENELHDSAMMAGALRHVLTLPTVLEKARISFGCPTLAGVRLAGDDTNDLNFAIFERDYGCYKRNFTTYLTLWSGKMMLNDFMSDLIVSDRAEYSSITMAVFQDSGWYEVDWSYTALPRFGYQRGCDFFTTPCLSGSTSSFSEYCAPNQESCSSDFTAKGLCSTTQFPCGVPSPYQYLSGSEGGNAAMDFCTLIERGISCLDGEAEFDGEEHCPDCRCFSGQYKLSGSSESTRNVHCHRVSCDGGVATVHIGTTIVSCPPAGGDVTIQGYTGTLKCPSVERICKPAPCKNLCSGHGRCESSVCVCENGFFGEDCSLLCKESCLECAANSQTICISCHRGAYLNNGMCVCNAQFHLNTLGECVSTTVCAASCLSCFGTGLTDCKSCRSPAVLTVAGSCQCPDTMVMGTDGQCVNCGAGCVTCSYPDTSTCLSTRRLGDPCLPTQFLNPANSQCENCLSPCASCSGSSTSCLSCNEGFQLSGAQCLCPDGRFVNDGQCLPCHAFCATCSGDKESDCLSCRADALLKANPGHCVCRATDSISCSSCDPECLTCSVNDPFLCETCRDIADVDQISKRCVCQDGFFMNSTTYECDMCHSSCTTCFGPTPHMCNSCVSDYDTISSYNCRCNEGRYIDLTLLKCVDCLPHCSHCETKVCLTCIPGFSVNGNGECVLNIGYYFEEETKTLYNCPAHCKSCEFDLNKTLVCTECKDTFLMDLNTITCYCESGKGFPSWEDKCQLCHDRNCDQCSSDLYCDKCLPTYTMIWYSTCVCVTGFYEVNHTCQACAQDCGHCTGPLDTDCTGCFSGFYLDKPNNFTCTACHPWCKECSGPDDNECTTCWDYSSFVPDVPGKCWCNFRRTERTCFYDPARDLCDPRCKECNGPSFRQCSSCYESGVLQQYASWGWGGVGSGATCDCLPDKRSSGDCWPCSFECETCNELGTCKTCFSWTQMSQDSSGKCLCTSWELRYFPNPSIFVCQYCNNKCTRCDGPNENNCLACIPAAELQPDHTCKCRGMSAMTPNGYCFTGSFFCADELCSICRNHAVRRDINFNGNWVGDCYCPATTDTSTGLYPDPMAGICHECGPLCLDCARDTRMCWNCKANSHLTYIHQFGAPGFCQCNDGFFVSYEYKECLVCPPGCSGCQSETLCTACSYGYELTRIDDFASCECFSPLCKCPIGFFAVPPFSQCEQHCPTGYLEKDRHCIATENTKFVFRPVSIEKTISDGTNTFEAVLGNPDIEKYTEDPGSPAPVYQKGLYFPPGKAAYVTIKGFVFAPVVYLELWERGTHLLSVKKGSNFSFSASSVYISLVDSSNTRSEVTFPLADDPTSGWVLLRIELQAYKYRLGTHLIVYHNNKPVLDKILSSIFYRDGAFDGAESDLTIFSTSPEETLLSDFIVANRLWAAELQDTACGCSLCTIAGSCLSDCAGLEFMRENSTCGQCNATCSFGCVRETDCSLCIDPLCVTYTNFTGCSACKDLTTIKDGVCSCIESASLRTNNSTCTCDVHYSLVDSACMFVPDPMCANYTKEPKCDACVKLAEIENDFCTCIPNSNYSSDQQSCMCFSHYVYNETDCIFDPLCAVLPSNTSSGCSECSPLSTYKEEICQCVSNASVSLNDSSCVCDVGFKPYNNSICIPVYDPLCTFENGDSCTNCTALSTLQSGRCECIENSQYQNFTKSCVCSGGLAALNGVCVVSPDPLCEVLASNMTCLACKSLAVYDGSSCQCSAIATLSPDGFSCVCAPGFKPFEDICIPAYDPLCTSEDGYLCLACAPLSSLIRGQCVCNTNATFQNETSSCMCGSGLAEQNATCVPSNDPLCRALRATGGCETCKPLAVFNNGVCACRVHSAYIAANTSCSCDLHYAAVNSMCTFQPDPLCRSYTDARVCSKCKSLSEMRNDFCQCLPNASPVNGTCSCDFHYKLSGSTCVFDPDPLCRTYNSLLKCSQCVPAAYYDGAMCQCVGNSTRSADGRSCTCLSDFKYYPSKCIPKNDPLCISLEDNNCVKCSPQAELVEGVCQCVANAGYNNETEKCGCDEHYATFAKQCVYSSDPLCVALDSKKNCQTCKPQSELKAKTCTCVSHSSFLSSNSTCLCDLKYFPVSKGCQFDADPMCDKYDNNDVCTKCKELGVLAGENCDCVQSATKNAKKMCVCDVHYISSQRACVFDPDPLCLNYTSSCLLCKPNSSVEDAYCRCLSPYAFKTDSEICEPCFTYLTNKDVTAELSDDFSQLVLTFSYPVQSNANCKSMFEGSIFAKFGSQARCVWNIDNSILTVSLGTDASIVEENIVLNATAVLKSNRRCSFKTDKVQKSVAYRGKKSKLIPVLKVPDTFALGCSETSKIVLDAKGTMGGMGATLLYKWSIVHSTAASLFTEYNVYSTKNLLSLSAKSLPAGTLTVTVTVKDRLGNEAIATASVVLTEDLNLAVEFDSGNVLNITSDTQGLIRAIVTSTCGQTGLRTFVWSYEGTLPPLGSSDKDPASVLGVSKAQYILVVEKGALTPGHTYTFKVKVTQGALTGSAALTINVVPSNLIVRLNRVSGNHPKDVNMSVSAVNSRDPDNLPGDIQFQWTCLEGLTECKDSSDAVLMTDTGKAAFSIAPERLRVGAVYNFTVIARKDTRATSVSVVLTIVEPSGLMLLLSPFFQKCKQHQYFAVVPNIETRYQTFFKWQQVPEITVTPDSAVDASYLAFPAYRLTSGTQYNFELTGTTLLGTMKMQVGFYVISVPASGTATIDPTSGREVLDPFLISTSGWTDPDDNYPLSYQLCARISATTDVCVTPVQKLTWKSTKLSHGQYQVVAKVFNSLGGYSETTADVSVEDIPFYRSLATTDFQASFSEDISDPEDTLGMISMYSRSIPLDASFYKLIFKSLREYMSTVFEVSEEVTQAFLGATETLSSQNMSRTTENSLDLLTLANNTLERFSSEFTESSLNTVFSIAGNLETVSATAADALRQAAIAKYYAGKYPGGTVFQFATNSSQFLSTRVIAGTFSATKLSTSGVTVSLPGAWLANTTIAPTDIVDLHLTASNNSTWTVRISLAKTGTYSNYNVAFRDTQLLAPLINVTAAFTVAFPSPTSANTTALECVALNSASEWNPSLCSLVSLTIPGTAVISTNSVTSYMLRAVTPNIGNLPSSTFTPTPEAVSGSEDGGNEFNPVPGALATALLIASLVGILVFRKSSPKIIVSEEVLNFETFNQKPIATNQVLPTSEDPGQECKPLEVQSSASTPRYSVFPAYRGLWSHIFLSAVKERSPVLISLSAMLLMTQSLILGLCYRFWAVGDPGITTSADVFASFTGIDMAYVGIAIAAASLSTTILQAFSQLIPLRRMITALCLLVVFGEFAGVWYLNQYLDYARGGRWGEAVLWAGLIQIVVVETAKSAVSWGYRRLVKK